MNKRNKILVGCLALLLALSVGYALFSQTITINGTATAKGNFDIEGNCITEFPNEFVSEELREGHGYKNEICSVSDDANSVLYQVEYEYPNAKKIYAYVFTNIGTIKAELDANTAFDSLSQATVNVYNSQQMF